MFHFPPALEGLSAAASENMGVKRLRGRQLKAAAVVYSFGDPSRFSRRRNHAMAEVGGRWVSGSGVRDQRAEGRDQRAEVRSQKLEVISQKSEGREQWVDGRRSEIRGGGQRKETYLDIFAT